MPRSCLDPVGVELPLANSLPNRSSRACVPACDIADPFHSSRIGLPAEPLDVAGIKPDPQFGRFAALVASQDAAVSPDPESPQRDAELPRRHFRRHEPIGPHDDTPGMSRTSRGDAVLLPHGRDPAAGPGFAVAAEQALVCQRGRDLVVGHPGGQVTDRLEHAGVRAQAQGRAGAARPVCGAGTPAPENQDVCAAPAFLHRYCNACSGQAEQALAVHRRRGVRLPQGRQVRCKPADVLRLHGVQRPQLGEEQALVVLLQPLGLGQRRFPAPLQLAGDQAVVGVDRVILPLGQPRLVAGALETELPLRANDNETLSPREFSLEGAEG